MKAIRIESTGLPQEVAQFVELPSPEPSKGKISVRILASPINPADINFIEGRYGVKPGLPCTPGMEACGEVLSSDHPDFPVGKKVIFLRSSGCWAEKITASPDDLVPLPDDIDPLQASMLKVNPLTAHCMLTLYEQLAPGDIVLQNAANSNVGRCVIQLCKERGVTTVNTVRREELIPELKALGADHVFLDDGNVKAQLVKLDLPAPRLALNCVCGDSAIQQLKVLKNGGSQVTYGAMAKKPLSVPAGLMIFKTINLHGYWLSAWMKQQSATSLRAIYSELASHITNTTLVQAIDQTFPLDDIQNALITAQKSGRNGKILLTP